MKSRCPWPGNNRAMIDYHDREWGVPLRNDAKIFEFMVLDAFQAGLSWAIVLKKRRGFEKAFARFNPQKVARFDKKKIQKLLQDETIIRNRQKVEATVENAKQFLKVQKEFGGFHKYVWRFVGGRPKVNRWKLLKSIPSKSKESDVMSLDLKNRGFKFVGSTICYAFMQAAGLVNDHLVTCFRHRQLAKGR